MKITPIEIRQRDFEKAFRGYEKEEVDAFLKSLSQEWEKVMDENKDIRRRLETAEAEVQRLRNVENSLFKTLKTAEDTGASVIEQANKAAELHLREAQMNAESVLNDARTRARNMMEEAEEKSRVILDELQEEVRKLMNDYHFIEDQKELLLQSLKNMANDTLERVSRIASKDARGEMAKKLKEIRAMAFDAKKERGEHYPMEEPRRQPVQEERPSVPEQPQPHNQDEQNKSQENPGTGSFFDNV